MQKVRINQGRVVPLPFRLFLTMAVLVVMSYCLTNVYEFIAIPICITISFIIPAIWSAFYILEIDQKNKSISKVTWIMGRRKNETEHYQELEKIFINVGKMSQRITSWGGNVHHRKVSRYMAYLKTEQGEKYFLLSAETEEGLLKKLLPIEQKLTCPTVKNY